RRQSGYDRKNRGCAVRKTRPRDKPDRGPHAASQSGSCRSPGVPHRRGSRCEPRSADRQQFEGTAGLKGRSRPLPRKAQAEQVTLEFADNKLLAALCGPHQKNFARLEQRLSVLITQRGTLAAMAAPADTRARAAAILRALYARLEAGESITLAEVDAEIRFTDPAANGRGTSEGAIRTATTRITKPRSPAQAAYLDLMREKPLV